MGRQWLGLWGRDRGLAELVRRELYAISGRACTDGALSGRSDSGARQKVPRWLMEKNETMLKSARGLCGMEVCASNQDIDL